jgi:hypothetical protein
MMEQRIMLSAYVEKAFSSALQITENKKSGYVTKNHNIEAKIW